MQNQIANWETAAVEITKQLVPLLTVVVPTLITALVAYLSLRHQRKLEEDKFNGQIKLEARKLFFNSYEQDIARSQNSFNGFQQGLAKLQIEILFPNNEQEKNEALKAYQAIMSQIVSSLRDGLEGLKIDLAERGLLDERKELIKPIENFVSLDFTTATEGEVEAHCMSAFRAMSLLSSFQQESLNERRHELFIEYLPLPRNKMRSIQKK